ncbi:hypothetical protein BJ138DRAFT_1112152 [Hygrophoropsis aurantiaca]|uniref:Uncharacterized protein n=1 Tax=Hygrophoropsis aurantiaca TaxID=72124 RepID=A0ACB8AGV9_9AGAM|nr:hypothetical protein BJ138DRAFT_1112152 [Hygrophoropsis aurantiaca]
MSLSTASFTLPIELWDECWSYVAFLDLFNVSLVCHLFRQLCQRRMFRSLSMKYPRTTDVKATNVKRWINAFEVMTERHIALSQSVNLRPLVHRCQLIDLSPGAWDTLPYHSEKTFKEAWQTARRALVTSFPCYQNLTSLKVYYLDIDASVRKILSQIRSLECLELFGCTFTSDGAKGPLLRLRMLELKYTSPHEHVDPTTAVEFVLPDRLEKLSFQNKKWLEKRFYPALSCLIRNFCIVNASQLPHPHLLHPKPLSFIGEDSQSGPLVCPSVPKLRELKAPISIAALLTFRRPIAVLCLHDPHENYSFFVASLPRLVQITMALRSLDLSTTAMFPCVGIFALILENFPALEALALGFHHAFDAVLDAVGETSSDGEDGDENDNGVGNAGTAGGAAQAVESSITHSNAEEPLRRQRKRKIHYPKYFDGDSYSSNDPSGDNIFGVRDTIPIEVGEDGLPVRQPDTFAGLMDWVALGHARLPPNIKILRLTQQLTMEEHPDMQPRYFGRQQQRSVVWHLSRKYSQLDSIALGWYGRPWTRTFCDLWEEPSSRC